MSKKPIKFYNELSQEERKGIPYLPLVKATKEKKAAVKSLSEEKPPEKVSGGEDIPYLPEIRKAGVERKSLELVSSNTTLQSTDSERENEPANRDDEETSLKVSQAKISHVIEGAKAPTSEQQNSLDGRRFYFELSAEEKEDIVFLPDHFKKTGKPYDTAARSTGHVIAFRREKKPLHSVFPAYRLQKAAMAVAACLMIAVGGKAIFNGVDNISKRLTQTSGRFIASENRIAPSSLIIKDLKNKEIPITKAVRSRNP